ncbi:FumA C-terminus/TtdB family hydratase beta subunit [Candidatus Xianfuyuplasma coldseepsis]|uniref:TRZ/ATZ family protein n=1 Tax=Candidatus Xianfuyuplasma coldseepsis TaxID=2782163 RepID=A0A7L7KQD9_9MOLU|nr:FumA C-terminus/TtdB family hydratase beta subunit [Xianfuyuplasma coldseepsis]QMS85011.1 TRZ/ATZ family protein [Xianfuyuplasma coldseepsis]
MIRMTTPITNDDVERLYAGEKVLISGTIYTARDQAHIRLLTEERPAFDIDGSVIFYVGPTPARGGNPIGSSGPTSSYRMDNITSNLMQQGLKLMIGKGDRSEAFRQEMMKYKSVYLIATGGAGALLASTVLSSKTIMYEDLGAEAIRELTVKDFPCFVAYDIHGGNIFQR